MTRTPYRLPLALTLSLLAHLLPVLAALVDRAETPPPPPPPTPSAALQARLAPPPARDPVPMAQPPLVLPDLPPPETTKSTSRPLTGNSTTSRQPHTWVQTVKKHLQKLEAEGQFYPAEAIAQGLEGDVLVLLIIDERGQVAGARIEESSGHRLLDDAALRAARSLRSEAADTPRETLLPIRFRLR